MKTKIIKIKGDWQEVVDDCRSTVGKESLGKEPSRSFKRKILIAEHSPIRDIIVKWRWRSIKTWITVHWVRHKWEKFVKSQRPDRTGVERGGPDTPVDFTGEANAQHLIDTWRKRLCYQASKETREYAEDFKVALHEVLPEVSDVLVPNCVYRCGCPEMESCKFFRDFVKRCSFVLGSDFEPEDMFNIQHRYDQYNDMFWERMKKERKA